MADRFDEHFFLIAKETGGIEGLLNSLFSFLLRRTDYYYECDPGDKMGFPPGVALNMLGNIFKNIKMNTIKYIKRSLPKNIRRSWKFIKKQKELQEKQKNRKNQRKKHKISKSNKSRFNRVRIKNNRRFRLNKSKTNKRMRVLLTNKNRSIHQYLQWRRDRKYSWSQSGNDVVVTMKVPEGSNKNIKVLITANTLTVKVKDNVVVDGKLYDKVKCDESVWSIEENLLTITLEKGQENIWKTVIQGDQEIDATKVENTKPLDDFDSETQGAIRKIMYDQQRKQQGLPTTEEEQQLEMLKKAWDAEGSPFKGQPFDPSKFNLSNGQIQF